MTSEAQLLKLLTWLSPAFPVGAFGYSQGEFTERAKVKAGERFIRASYPELANLDSPLQNINPDMRRGLFVDYLDIVGPFNPSTAPPASYNKIFICSATTTQCALRDPRTQELTFAAKSPARKRRLAFARPGHVGRGIAGGNDSASTTASSMSVSVI